MRQHRALGNFARGPANTVPITRGGRSDARHLCADAQYAITADQHPKTVYVREQAIVPSLDEWIGSLFADEHLDATCEALAAVSDLDPPDEEGRELDLRRRLKDCDAKVDRYRALLEVNSEITSAATWIAEVERERRGIERDLGRKPTSRKHTKNEIKALVRQLKDIVGTLAKADPEDKRAIYDELGVNLTYHQDGCTWPQDRVYSGIVSEGGLAG